MRRTCGLVVATLVFLGIAGMQRVHAAGGSGEAGISGYTVSDVHYALTATGLVSGVSFRLDGVAKRAEVRLNPSERWHACAVSGRNVTCSFPRQPVALRALRALAVTAVS
jgi:hypothetical protein